MTNAASIHTQDVNVHYGEKQALFNVNTHMESGKVTALIGPSGCGKSTFLRCINRMNDTIENCTVTGKIEIAGTDINAPNQDPVLLRSHVGMVFQKPNPFPKSIYDNIAYGPRLHNLCKDKPSLDTLVEKSLTSAGLWDEVKDRLYDIATGLSGGQQQRLCIARTLAVSPDVILMDEPCSALDPIATARIEELIGTLTPEYTVVIVTHSMQQARRVSQNTVFFHLGHIVESGETRSFFDSPKHQQTKDYISGRYG